MAKVQWANPIKAITGVELKINDGSQEEPNIVNFTFGKAAIAALNHIDVSPQGQPEKLSFKDQLRRGRLQEAIYNAEQKIEPMEFSNEDRVLLKELVAKSNFAYGPVVALRFEEFFEGPDATTAAA